jgi:hypothetical protein
MGREAGKREGQAKEKKRKRSPGLRVREGNLTEVGRL